LVALRRLWDGRGGQDDAGGAGRSIRLITLVTPGQLPAAVLASLLSLHPNTADRWSRRIASDWTAYLKARTQPDQ
jgi:hypothetical protein